jgi:hypothetical protein
MNTTHEPLASSRSWLFANLAFFLTCLLVAAALASGCGCTPRASTGGNVREASAQELRSTVALVAVSAEWREPELSSEAFSSSSGRLRVSYLPYCNAFALRFGREPKQLRLVTAAHCLARARLAIGDAARYQEPSGWSAGKALVSYIDSARDYAELVPEDSSGLVALEPAHERELALGAFVSSPSALFGEETHGRVTSLPFGRVVFTGSITQGWSGSPVLDTSGRAVGVVTRCVTSAAGSSVCADGVIAGLL